MARGATRKHNLVSGNVFGELRNQLKGKNCEIYINDMRVRMEKNRYGYPDVVVVCQEPKFEDDEFDTLNNPALAVEVLSNQLDFVIKRKSLKLTKRWKASANVCWASSDTSSTVLFHKTCW